MIIFGIAVFSKILLPVVLELGVDVSYLAFNTPDSKYGENGDVVLESDNLVTVW